MVDLDNIHLDTNYQNESGELVGDALKRLEFQRQQRLHLVPTVDVDVRKALELIGAPTEVKEENNYDRRERLAEKLLSDEKALKLLNESFLSNSELDVSKEIPDSADEEEFYTPAEPQLIKVREYLIKFSNSRALKRLEIERNVASSVSCKNVLTTRRALQQKLKQFKLRGTQVVAEKQIATVNISPNGDEIACGSWSGELTLVNPSLKKIYTNRILFGSKISGVDWSPDGKNITSCTHDGKIVTFDPMSDGEYNEIYRNNFRFAQVKYHPSGKLIASTCFDKTWYLFDVEKPKLLLSQEGHSGEVFSLAFHNDGSLLATGDLEGVGLIWDIRSGKTIMSLVGHSKPLYSLDWSFNGYQLASGSGDGTIKIWDIRKKVNVETILAHNSIVSQVKFNRGNDKFLVSCGYDKTVKIFNEGNWIEEASLKGHIDKVMAIDLYESHIFSAGWDRSLNKWDM